MALVGMEAQVRDARASCKARRSHSLQQRASCSSYDFHPAAASSAAFGPAAAPARATVSHVYGGRVGGGGCVTWDPVGASGGSELGAQHLALQEQLLRQLEHYHNMDGQQLQLGQTPCGQQQQQQQQVLQRWTELEQQRGQLQQGQQGSQTGLPLDPSWHQPGGPGSSSSRMLSGRSAVSAPPAAAATGGCAHAWLGSAAAAAATAGTAAATGAAAAPVAESAAAPFSGDRELSLCHRRVDCVDHAVHTNAVLVAEGGGADGGAWDDIHPSPAGFVGAVAASRSFISSVPSSSLEPPFVPPFHEGELYGASPFTGPGYSYMPPSAQACLHYMTPRTGGAGPMTTEATAAEQQQQQQRLVPVQGMGLSCGWSEVSAVGPMWAHMHGAPCSAPFAEPPSSSYGSCTLPPGTGVGPFAFPVSHMPMGSCTSVSNCAVGHSNRWSLPGALPVPSGPSSTGSLPPCHVMQQRPPATGPWATNVPSPSHDSAAIPSLPFPGSGPIRGMSLPTTLPSSLTNYGVGPNTLPLSNSGCCSLGGPAAGPAFAPVPYGGGGVVFPPCPRPQDLRSISGCAGPGAPLDAGHHGLLRAGSMPGELLPLPNAGGGPVLVPAAPRGEQCALRPEQPAGQAVQWRGSDGGGAAGCGAGGKLPSASRWSPVRPAARPPLPVPPYRGLMPHAGGVYGSVAVGPAGEGSCRRGSLGRQAALQHVPEDDGDLLCSGEQPQFVGHVASEE